MAHQAPLLERPPRQTEARPAAEEAPGAPRQALERELCLAELPVRELARGRVQVPAALVAARALELARPRRAETPRSPAQARAWALAQAPAR